MGPVINEIDTKKALKPKLYEHIVKDSKIHNLSTLIRFFYFSIESKGGCHHRDEVTRQQKLQAFETFLIVYENN